MWFVMICDLYAFHALWRYQRQCRHNKHNTWNVLVLLHAEANRWL